MAKRRRSASAREGLMRQQRLLIGAVVLGAILVVGIFSIANKQTADAGYYRHVGPSELDRVVQGNEPVLVYFHSPTWVFCQQTAPVLERLTNEEEVVLYVLNVNQHSAKAREYGVMSTPTVIRFLDGKEQTRLSGLQDESVWLRLLQLQK